MDPHYIDTSSKGNSKSKGSERSNPRKKVLPVRVPPAHRVGLWTLHICPTTGGNLELVIQCTETVDGLKKAVGKTLRIPKERINLLHKDRLLKEGPLLTYGLVDGSKLTLLPNVETGLVSQKPDHSVMQALENLSEGQVNDFLTGKCPLTLAMRLGDHMMFVQLQLSTATNGVKRSTTSSSHHSSKRRRHHAGTSSSTSASATFSSSRAGMSSSSAGPSSATSTQPTAAPTTYPSLSLTCTHPAAASGVQATMGLDRRTPCPTTTCAVPTPLEGRGSPSAIHGSRRPGRDELLPEKLAHLPHPHYRCPAPERVPHPSTSTNASSSRGHCETPTKQLRTSPLPSVSSSQTTHHPLTSQLLPPQPSSSSTSGSRKESSSPSSTLLKSSPQGAIIESMHHLGQGVYSGTFSGTLNPALQDQAGKPKRSINTIVHILNDLLGATPEYAAYYGSRAPAAHREYTMSHRHKSSHSNRFARKAPTPDRVQEENKMMKGKVQHLQQMLQEKRERRRARRAARSAPYSWTTLPLSHDSSNNDTLDSDQSMDVPTSDVDVTSDVDSANFTELKADSSSDAELKHTGTIVA